MSSSRIRHIETPICFVVVVLVGMVHHSLAEEAAQRVVLGRPETQESSVESLLARVQNTGSINPFGNP